MIEAYGGLSIQNPVDHLVIMEEISEISGADGFRLYSPDANYIYSFPETVSDGKLYDYQRSSTKEQGSGLGLTISKQLSVSIRAKLRLVKADKNGTTFELLLVKVKDGLTDSVKDFR